MYEDKGEQYYSHVRREVAPLIPQQCQRVLEIGCGQGDTLVWLKDSQANCQWIGGVELFPESAKIAQQRLDWFCVGNIEGMDLPIEKASLDLILCLDVLEHLVDPWNVVARLDALLKPGGAIVVSIPNIRYFKASLGLVVFGNWRYEQEGTLDRTHLRFFTKKTAIELMQSSGLHCDRIIGGGLEKGRKARWLNFLTLGLLRPFFEFQYLIRVIKR
jgi:2-polyprenyl-3-methyl-5-hydroxy-6-metoxy-1,4-benzoquinol methylase